MATEVGKFVIDNNTLSGPAAYMDEKGNALLDLVLAGKDTVFNMSVGLSPDIETAILVRLQTDYAGWRGFNQIMALSEKSV